MDILDITQWDASRAMSLVGFCELVSRAATSYIGDRFKGRIIPIYVMCTMCLCLQNIFGAFANTYNQLLIYAIGTVLCVNNCLHLLFVSLILACVT